MSGSFPPPRGLHGVRPHPPAAVGPEQQCCLQLCTSRLLHASQPQYFSHAQYEVQALQRALQAALGPGSFVAQVA
jgi:hypothetical protein